MKKFTILSPLVLLATTALAQDSTCILQPSCSQLGYTSAEADCGSQKVLRCPFDVSQVACVGGSSNSGTGGSGGLDNPNDPNNEYGDAIVFEVKISSLNSGGSDNKYSPLYFKYGGGNIVVDCGNGTFYRGGSSGNVAIECRYYELGTFIIKARGSFTYFSALDDRIISLLNLNKPGIKKFGKMCLGVTTSVPPLPASLEDGTEMFKSCGRVQGMLQDFSTLPNLTTYTDMFATSGIKQEDNPSWPAEAW